MVTSSNSLNRALASCTFHAAIREPAANYMTSHQTSQCRLLSRAIVTIEITFAIR